MDAPDNTVTEVRKLLQSLQKSFQCTICLDLLSQPISTKCNHQFCSQCIKELLVKSDKKRPVTCPLCKNKITKRSINSNPQIAEIVTCVRDVCNAADDDCERIGATPILSQRHKKTIYRNKVRNKKVKSSLSFVSNNNSKSHSIFDLISDDDEGAPKTDNNKLSRKSDNNIIANLESIDAVNNKPFEESTTVYKDVKDDQKGIILVNRKLSNHEEMLNKKNIEEYSLLDRIKKGHKNSKSPELSNPQNLSGKRKSFELSSSTVLTNDAVQPKKRKKLSKKQAKQFKEDILDISPEIEFENSEKNFHKTKNGKQTKAKHKNHSLDDLRSSINVSASIEDVTTAKKVLTDMCSSDLITKSVAVDSTDQTVPQSVSTDATVTPVLPDIFCQEKCESIETTNVTQNQESESILNDGIEDTTIIEEPEVKETVNEDNPLLTDIVSLPQSKNAMEIDKWDKINDLPIHCAQKNSPNKINPEIVHHSDIYVRKDETDENTKVNEHLNNNEIVSTPPNVNKSCHIQLSQISVNESPGSIFFPGSKKSVVSTCRRKESQPLTPWKLSLGNTINETVDIKSFINNIESPNKDHSMFGNVSFSKVPLPVKNGVMKPVKIMSAERISATEAVVSIKYKMTVEKLSCDLYTGMQKKLIAERLPQKESNSKVLTGTIIKNEVLVSEDNQEKQIVQSNKQNDFEEENKNIESNKHLKNSKDCVDQNMLLSGKQFLLSSKGNSEELIPPTPPGTKVPTSFRKSMDNSLHCQDVVDKKQQTLSHIRDTTKADENVALMRNKDPTQELKVNTSDIAENHKLMDSKSVIQDVEPHVEIQYTGGSDQLLYDEAEKMDLAKSNMCNNQVETLISKKANLTADVTDAFMCDIGDEIDVYTNEKKYVSGGDKSENEENLSESLVGSCTNASCIVDGNEKNENSVCQKEEERLDLDLFSENKKDFNLGKKFRENINQLKREKQLSQNSVDFDVSEPDLIVVECTNSKKGERTRSDDGVKSQVNTGAVKEKIHMHSSDSEDENLTLKRKKRKKEAKIVSDEETSSGCEENPVSNLKHEKSKKLKRSSEDGRQPQEVDQLQSVTLCDTDNDDNDDDHDEKVLPLCISTAKKMESGDSNNKILLNQKAAKRERRRLERDRIAEHLKKYIDEIKQNDEAESSDDDILERTAFEVKEMLDGKKNKASVGEDKNFLFASEHLEQHEDLEKTNDVLKENTSQKPSKENKKSISDTNLKLLKQRLLSPITNTDILRLPKEKKFSDWKSSTEDKTDEPSTIISSRMFNKELSPTTPSNLLPVPISQSTILKDMRKNDFKKPVNVKRKSSQDKTSNISCVDATPKVTCGTPKKMSLPDEVRMYGERNRKNIFATENKYSTNPIKKQSPHTTTTNMVDEKESVKHQKPVIMTSRLSKKQVNACTKVCQKLGAKIVQTYSESVTHLVVVADENNAVAKMSYTYKYLMSLVAGLWIVDFKWIMDSFQNDLFVKEEKYEVKGDPAADHQDIPKLYRRARSKNYCLFDGYRMCLVGKFEQSQIGRDQLLSLLRKSGAEIVYSLNELKCSSSQIQTMMITDGLNQLTSRDRELLQQYPLPVIHPEWIVESIINFSIQDTSIFDLSRQKEDR
ncbi:breast cancer type 1 susceptibility protein homolog isoform X2 [Hydractinia symbiolongicarpus]|uniref:breast cancer type 1 susceptibility protein homolog isoform X2 n=1 Tax=Hydractinia symbiolongicarpus TaxID=13093 RepID=UPI00254A639C|nr:breast cancer type 1 susceptibility protein homolog isoform X2 [Hydractinia symbiolongicarpus]